MNIHSDNSRIRIIKIFASLFVIGCAIYLLLCSIMYLAIKQNSISLPIEFDINVLVLGAIIFFLYSLIICYGLFGLRKWALYVFSVPAIWYFFWGVFEFLTQKLLFVEASDIYYLLPRLFLGLMALYIYRERHLFKPAIKNR